MARRHRLGLEEGCGEDLRQVGHGQELDVLLDLVVHLVQIGHVILRDEDGLHPLAVSGHALLAEAADGQHIAVEGDLAGHGHIAPHRDAGQAGDEGRGQGDAGRGAVFGDCALRGMDMQVALLEALGVDAVLCGMDAGIGDGQLGALLHHVAQRTGDGDLAAAVVDDLHLDGQGLAADAGPCQTVGDADGVGAVEELGLDHAGSQQLFEAGAGDGDILRLAGSDLPGALAQDAGDGALQIADAGLAGVAVDDAVEGALGEGDLAGQAAGVQLLGDQMLPGDVVLFHPGVAGQLDDVHAVAQRAGDGAEVVGRGDEEHMAQIKRHIDEMVVEGAVLLGVEGFQQSGRRVAPEVACQLVDLVQKHQGVRALGRDHGGDDLAGHRADVGAAVAADLGLIPHAAEADADILAVQALGDGAGDAGLADTRRADEADDLALYVGGQLADGQHLEDAVLDLLQAVVVPVQHALGLGDVQIVLGESVPGQVEAGVQIGADDRAFLIAALHLGEAVHLFEKLLFPVLVQMEGRDLPAVLLGLGGGIVVLAQLLADHVELLVEVVVALVLVHRLVYLLGDLLIDLEHPALPVHLLDEQMQTAHQGAFVQNGLLILEAEQEVGRDVLGQESGVGAGGDGKHHVLADVGVQRQQVVKALFDVADEDVRLRQLLGLRHLDRGRADGGQQEAAVVLHLGEFGAVFAFDQDADEVIRHPHHLLDLGHDAVSIEVGGLGVLDLHLFLCHEEDVRVVADGPLHGGDALLAAHLEVEQIVGEDHQPAQGDGRKVEDAPLHLDRNFFRHSTKPPSRPSDASHP